MKKRASEQGFAEIKPKGKLRELASEKIKQGSAALAAVNEVLATDLTLPTRNKYFPVTKSKRCKTSERTIQVERGQFRALEINPPGWF